MTSNPSSASDGEPNGSGQEDEDLKLVKRLEKAIIRNARGLPRFKKEIPLVLRKAIDQLIDSANTGRFTLEETEKTEKTFLGTKVEMVLRTWLRFPWGNTLDLSIDGVETDIKNTMGTTWMIPSEAVNRPCILVKTDEKRARFSIGIIVARGAYLGAKNRDGKRSILASGRSQIHWILEDETYPENPWQQISPEIRKKITSPASGAGRLDALFRQLQEKPVSRVLVLGVAQQKDAMKRLRKNGGARDSLARDGIALLSGNYDSTLIQKLGLPRCKKDEFISFRPVSQTDKSLLRAAGHIK